MDEHIDVKYYWDDIKDENGQNQADSICSNLFEYSQGITSVFSRSTETPIV